MGNTELLPCPFCGGHPNVMEIPPHQHHLVIGDWKMPDSDGCAYVECACSATVGGDTKEQAIALWNRRSYDD